MAISFNATAGAAQASLGFVGSSANIGPITGVATGDAILLYLTSSATMSGVGVSDAQGSYTLVGSEFHDTTNGFYHRVYILPNANSGSHTITVTTGGQVLYYEYVVYSGAAASPVDGFASTYVSGTTLTVTVSNAQAGDTVVSWATSDTGQSPALSSSSGTTRSVVAGAIAQQDEVASTSGNWTPSFTFASTEGAAVLAVGLIPASGGGGTFVPYTPYPQAFVAS